MFVQEEYGAMRQARFMFVCQMNGFPWRGIDNVQGAEAAAVKMLGWMKENMPSTYPHLLTSTAISATIDGEIKTLTFSLIEMIP